MQMASAQLKIINIIMKMSWQHFHTSALPTSATANYSFQLNCAIVSLLLRLFICVLRRQKREISQTLQEVEGALESKEFGYVGGGTRVGLFAV